MSIDEGIQMGARRYLMGILAVLCDVDYLRHVWVEHRSECEPTETPTEVWCGLYDDLGVLPDPNAQVGRVVLEGEECAHLMDLARAVERVDSRVDLFGPEEYLRVQAALDDPDWPLVARAAGLTLAAIVRRGGYEQDPPV